MKFAPVLAVVVATALSACSPGADPAFGAKVRAYLLEHPEVLEEAIQKLQEKRQAEAGQAAKASIRANRDAIERDPRDFVANPNGAITVTEFYDYRCGHCINAAPKVAELIAQNPDIRFVFKEMPIFGETSDTAAHAAIAIKRSGGDYLGFYKAAMGAQGLDDAMVGQLAAQHGANPAKVDKAAADEQLADVRKLAAALGIQGTPAFIIGDILVPGEDMEAVQAAIASARMGKKS